MKITAALAAIALSQELEFDEKKFSDDTEWLGKDPWESYYKNPQGYLIEQIHCRIDQYFDKYFVDTNHSKTTKRMKKHWNSTFGVIKKVINEKCGDIPDYTKTGEECKWKGWLKNGFYKDTNLFVSWPAMLVKAEVVNSDKYNSERCEKTGMRILKRIDRLNIYTIWHYCDKYDDSVEPCKWHYRTADQKRWNPRNSTAHPNIEKFLRDN